ncbi:MAG: hypothetical protein HY060_15555, partial [Proteobacteria bacterium]|nr:hypothetical protein [Pseudomonadota bacterium]
MSFVADPRLGLPGRSAVRSAFAPPAAAAEAPPRAAPTASAEGVDRAVVGFVTLDLVLMMLLQKFALPLSDSGEAQVSMLLITHYSVLGALMLMRRASLDAVRLAGYAAFLIVALLGQLWPDRSFGA